VSKTEDDMDKPVTRRELREELADYPKRQELETWGGALNAKIDATASRLDAKIEALGSRLDAKIDALRHDMTARFDASSREMAATFDALSLELARHANRILDSTREMVGVIDEKYNDLPRRVTTLEAKVFPPKRQRRR
jgi:hypothetical protein